MEWEITKDDILIVADRHGVKLTEEQLDQVHDALDHDAIIKGVLSYADFDDQADSALSDIEDQMIKQKLFITGPKLCENP